MRDLTKSIAVLFFLSLIINSCSNKKHTIASSYILDTEKQGLIMQKNPSQRNNLFSIDLIKTLEMSDKNTIISPFSINNALAMTYAGARKETMVQMSEVMYYPFDQDIFHPEFNKFSSHIQSLSTKNAGFELANSLYAQEGYKFLQEFFDLIIKNYGSVLNFVDFHNGDREAIRQEINNWVEEKTNSKIKELIKPNILNEDTRLVLVNAIYFLADWAKEFDKEMSYDGDFKTSVDSKSVATYMKADDEYRYYNSKLSSAVEIPYHNNKFSMLIVLPAENIALKEFINIFDHEKFNEINSGLESRKVEIHIPKFKMKTHIELQDILSEMGMPLAFSNKADFSGMTGDLDLKIDRVIHQAYIEVDEQGTEAAAATAVVIIRKTAILEPVEKTIFKADRPFLFFIKDNTENTIIFLGSIVDPQN